MSLSSWPRGRIKRVSSVTQRHFYCLAGTMSDTGAFDQCSCPLTGTDGGGAGTGRVGAVPADSQVLVCESQIARWHPYNVPILATTSAHSAAFHNFTGFTASESGTKPNHTAIPVNKMWVSHRSHAGTQPLSNVAGPASPAQRL